MPANTRIVLASRPQGRPSPTDFRIETVEVPALGDGEVLLETLFLSLDPYMRGRMSAGKSYVKGVDIGEVMVGQTVGEVVESRNPAFQKGDKVLTQLGWQLFGSTKEAFPVDGARAFLSYYLGCLGVPGLGWAICFRPKYAVKPGMPRQAR